MAKNSYRLCTACAIQHYDNCGTCFGFGVYTLPNRPGEVFPVSAVEAMETRVFRGAVQACPECLSTVDGAPL